MLLTRSENGDGYMIRGKLITALGFLGLFSRTCDVYVREGETEDEAVERTRKELNYDRR